MKKLLLLAGFFALVGFVCEDSGTSYDGICLGTFKYSAFDTLGSVVTTGTLTLYRNDSRLNGSWSFAQGGSGELLGSLTDGQIFLDLNPQFRDNNLLLQGTFTGNKFSGSWSTTGVAGVMATGSFIATKQ
jgi:hypothetical protein